MTSNIVVPPTLEELNEALSGLTGGIVSVESTPVAPADGRQAFYINFDHTPEDNDLWYYVELLPEGTIKFSANFPRKDEPTPSGEGSTPVAAHVLSLPASADTFITGSALEEFSWFHPRWVSWGEGHEDEAAALIVAYIESQV